MDLHTAREVMEGAESVNMQLGRLAELIDQVEDESLRMKLKLQLALAVGNVFIELMAPVIRSHPELDPDKLTYFGA